MTVSKKVFRNGKVYETSQSSVVPGKAKPVLEDVTVTTLYKTLKKIAREHYKVEESPINNGARGYTAHPEKAGRFLL